MIEKFHVSTLLAVVIRFLVVVENVFVVEAVVAVLFHAWIVFELVLRFFLVGMVRVFDLHRGRKEVVLGLLYRL